ncbi:MULTISPECIES: hypothetical protein [unclassified Microcoleus]
MTLITLAQEFRKYLLHKSKKLSKGKSGDSLGRQSNVARLWLSAFV